MENTHSGELQCSCKKTVYPAPLIVLTGGPGAGKTAVLEFVRKVLCKHVAILPESAGMLFSGGFWRLDSITSKRAAQKAIYYVQREMQDLVIEEKKWSIGLCDRGTLDGLAYWPGQEVEFFRELQTTREAEYSKYKAVIHLRTPDLDGGYNHQNPIRIETAAMAAEIDKKIHEVWKYHPRYYVIDNATNFIDKVNQAAARIQLLVSEFNLQEKKS